MDPMNGMFLQFLPPNTRGFLDAVSWKISNIMGMRTSQNPRKSSRQRVYRKWLETLHCIWTQTNTTQLSNSPEEVEKMAAPWDLQNHLWLTTPSNKVVGDQQLTNQPGWNLIIAWCLPITSTTGLLGGGVVGAITPENWRTRTIWALNKHVRTNYCEKYGL